MLLTGLDKEATYLSLGAAYSGLGRHQEAIVLFEKTRALFPEDLNPINNLGFEYLYLKDYPRAEKLLLEVVHKDPKFAMAYKNLGQLYLLQKKLPQALTSYRSALAIDPFLELTPQEMAFVQAPEGLIRR